MEILASCVGEIPVSRSTTVLRGGLNWSAQHSNLLAKMECGHETATSHLLLSRSAVRDLGSLASRRANEFDRAPVRQGVLFCLLCDLANGWHPPSRSVPSQTGAQPF